MTPTAQQVLALKRTEARPRNSAGLNSLEPLYWIERWIAGIALLVLAPLLAPICLAILSLSRRTPFVRHTRVGQHGEPLRMLKLRTMWESGQRWGRVFCVEDVSNPVPADKSSGDDRVTSRFAACCRRYSIDELPQLFHVLRGEMSLVGPRPITQAELEEHYGDSAPQVLALRPGLTGLWQIKGRSKLTYMQRRRLDLWMVSHASPGLYLRILLRSIPAVLRGADAY